MEMLTQGIFVAGVVIALVIGGIFLSAVLSAFYKVFLKKDTIQLKRVSELTEEEKEALLETMRMDERNWIQLEVEKHGDTIYFFDANDKNKFLFQCKTHEEMMENLNSIKGNKGVKIDEAHLDQVGLKSFFFPRPDEPLIRREGNRRGE